MIQYIYRVNIDPSVREIQDKIESDTLGTTDESTLTYYAIKLVAEIDRLARYSAEVADSENFRVAGLMDSIKASLDKLNSKIHYTDYFKGTKNDNPYINTLIDYRNSGMTLDDAIRNLTIQSSTPRGALSDFVKEMDYPSIDQSSREFSMGSDIASKYSGLNSLDNMYEHLESLKLSTDKMNDFIAGYLSVRPLTEYESNLESVKSKVHQFSQGKFDAKELLNEYDNYLRR